MDLVDLDKTFGNIRPNALQWDPVIFIRHGICSSSVPFKLLERHLSDIFKNSHIDNTSYNWRDSVLVNGARLANDVLKIAGGRPLVLIGHSMGGLLCRVANAIFEDPNHFLSLIKSLAPTLTFKQTDMLEISNFPFLRTKLPKPSLIITLATPNSGGILYGQVSGIPSLLKLALNLFPPTNLESVADLTSDRLFRFLQNFSVSTPILSVSGSMANRFARGSGTISTLLGRSGLKIEMPNDLIVEDRSVDLRYSILPNEFIHYGSSKYLHARCYLDCTDVWHSNIYDNSSVRKLLVDCLKRC